MQRAEDRSVRRIKTADAMLEAKSFEESVNSFESELRIKQKTQLNWA